MNELKAKSEIMKKCGEDSIRILEDLKKINKISNYYEDNLESKYKNNEGFSNEEKKVIEKTVITLSDINDEIVTFFNNKDYVNLFASFADSNDSYAQIINEIKASQLELCNLMEKYNELYILNNKHDLQLSRQYRLAKGLTSKDDTSLVDLLTWNFNMKEIGGTLVDQINAKVDEYGIRPVELNKGTTDSIFLGRTDWPLITPYPVAKNGFNNDIYEGTVIYKDGPKYNYNHGTMNIPNGIDTLVLYNPYTNKELDTAIESAQDKNVIISFFGDLEDKDKNAKIKQFNEAVSRLDEISNKLEDVSSVSGRQYVKTVFSKKKSK